MVSPGTKSEPGETSFGSATQKNVRALGSEPLRQALLARLFQDPSPGGVGFVFDFSATQLRLQAKRRKGACFSGAPRVSVGSKRTPPRFGFSRSLTPGIDRAGGLPGDSHDSGDDR